MVVPQREGCPSPRDTPTPVKWIPPKLTYAAGDVGALINYLCERLEVDPEAIDIQMITPERVSDFLLKRTDQRPPPSLTVEEVEAILACPDPQTPPGARDKVLLQVMYNTGARVQELAELTVADLHLQAPATVTLTGKGNKTRVIPLWEQTAEILNRYLRFREQAGVHSECLFLSSRGGP